MLYLSLDNQVMINWSVGRPEYVKPWWGLRHNNSML